MNSGLGVEEQLAAFLRDKAQTHLNAVAFWHHGSCISKYPALKILADRVLMVPASSAPVERVFSQGSILLRPHRNRLTPHKVQLLLTLKCNEHFFDSLQLM